MQCGHAIGLRRIHISVLLHQRAKRGAILLFGGVGEAGVTGQGAQGKEQGQQHRQKR